MREKYEVRSRNPMIIRSAPMAFMVYLTTKPYLLRKPKSRSKRIADRRNGTARPREYMLNRNAPCQTLFSVEAIIRMEDRAGPIQGVHPREKATPTTKDPNIPAGLCLSWITFSWLRKGILRRFRLNNPMRMSNIPPILVIYV